MRNERKDDQSGVGGRDQKQVARKTERRREREGYAEREIEQSRTTYVATALRRKNQPHAPEILSSLVSSKETTLVRVHRRSYKQFVHPVETDPEIVYGKRWISARKLGSKSSTYLSNRIHVRYGTTKALEKVNERGGRMKIEINIMINDYVRFNIKRISFYNNE